MSPHTPPQRPQTTAARPAAGKALVVLGLVLAVLNIGFIVLAIWRTSPHTPALAFWSMGTLVLAAGLFTLSWVWRRTCFPEEASAEASRSSAKLTNESHSRKFTDQLLLRSSLESGKCVCLAAGIDDFVQLTERHGPTVAEAVLCAVSRTLDANLRTSDIVGRVGDGVFAVVMPATTAEGARITADRIRVAVSQLNVPATPGSALQLSLSVGLCTLRPEDSVESLLDRSCQALAEARAQQPGSLKIL